MAPLLAKTRKRGIVVAQLKEKSLARFQTRSVGKVRQLLRLLDEISADATLGPAISLHGGTALNLFVLDVPRLSVDLDLNYVASADREVMRAARTGIEAAVAKVGADLGFQVAAAK
jgi:predicted nucleotidyltransferase component of viral defense system